MVQNDRGCGISCCWTKTPKNQRFKSIFRYRRSLSQKFRPKSFDELVGQNVVVRSLLGAIYKGRITSLYLFHGPRGTAKTSVARILACCCPELPLT
ncbi:hypothetical protein Peur_066635 [Populus x canadensis]